MVPRAIADLVRKRLRESPAVALVGARQSGKTTLARTLSDLCYDLEQPADRLRLDLEWNAAVAGRRLIVLDEAQEAPEVFRRMRSAIDAGRRRNGRFLLLVSVSPALMTQVSEPLAGRLAVIELTPLLLQELRGDRLQQLWLSGGFPDGGILGTGSFPTWQRDYLNLMTQRDLPNWGLPAQPQVTARLVRMLAAVHGQVWNASAVGQSLGLSYHTVNKYVD
jgi:predicted AAA+ superfamily ATPase